MAKNAYSGAVGSSIVEIGTLVTMLTLSMYALGYLRLAALYFVLDCNWVLRFNSAQDFITQGAPGVVSAFFAALAFSFRRDPDKAVDRANACLLVVALISIVIIKLLGVKLIGSVYLFDPILEVVSYAFLGPIFYALLIHASSSPPKAAKVVIYSVGATVALGAFIAFQTSSTYSQVTKGLGIPYSVSKDDGLRSVLIGPVNGKYLVRHCDMTAKFSIVDPGSEWFVTPMTLPDKCFDI